MGQLLLIQTSRFPCLRQDYSNCFQNPCDLGQLRPFCPNVTCLAVTRESREGTAVTMLYTDRHSKNSKKLSQGEGGGVVLSWVPESIYTWKYTVDLRTWGNANFQNSCSSRGRLITLKTSWKKWLVFEVYIPAQYCWSNLTNQTWNTAH